MSKNPHKLCLLLRELRLKTGMSLHHFADKHGISPVALGAYERGDRQPPVHTLDTLLGFHGYRLTAEPINGMAVPDEVAAELRTIADRLDELSNRCKTAGLPR